MPQNSYNVIKEHFNAYITCEVYFLLFESTQKVILIGKAYLQKDKISDKIGELCGFFLISVYGYKLTQ